MIERMHRQKTKTAHKRKGQKKGVGAQEHNRKVLRNEIMQGKKACERADKHSIGQGARLDGLITWKHNVANSCVKMLSK